MRAMYFAPLLLLSAFAISPASAAPIASQPVAVESPIVLAQAHRDRGPRHRAAPRRAGPQRFTPGRRYSSAPRGWHRYGNRPGDWRTRGCILVGPVWFCP